jgi:uncharacterized iron-regulated protein
MIIFKTLLINILILSSIAMHAQKKPAYNLFNAKGKKVNYGKMLRAIEKGDVLLFGELHNNPIAHWLQFEVTRDLHKSRQLILGAEMFEADNQQPLTDYIEKRIDAKELAAKARLWNNFNTDYSPLVNFARDNEINFVATNIPRPFASLVFKHDFMALDTLSELEKSWIAPLPIEYDPDLPGYKNMLTMMGGGKGETFPKAQAIKDATMAHFILRNYENDYLFIHFHGTYHSDNFEGILWYLKRQRPELNYFTISTVEQEDIRKLGSEHKGKAHIILVVDSNMTKTY